MFTKLVLLFFAISSVCFASNNAGVGSTDYASFGGQDNPSVDPFLKCSLANLGTCKYLTIGYNTNLEPTKSLQVMDGDNQYQTPPFIFTVTSANATLAATYTDSSGMVFTVTATISSATTLKMAVGTGVTTIPTAASGTLTKTSGTGDATITYSSFVAGKTFYETGMSCFSNISASSGADWGWNLSSFSNNTALGVASATIHYYIPTTGTFASGSRIQCASSAYTYNPVAGINFPPGVYPLFRGDLGGFFATRLYGVEIKNHN